MSLAENFIRDIKVVEDFDPQSKLEFYKKMYEIAQSKVLERPRVVEVIQRADDQLIRYCTMLTYKDDSRLFSYFHERGVPCAFEAYDKVKAK